MNCNMVNGRMNLLHKNRAGQSMIEFALILPLFVLFIIGIFELGRAFFSYIAVTNAAREGARVITFWPGHTTIQNVTTAVDTEIVNSPMVTVGNISSIVIDCGNAHNIVSTDAALAACPSQQPVRVTVTYKFQLLLNFISSHQINIGRAVEMMIP